MKRSTLMALLDITNDQISYYKDFMAGEGNHDEFEFVLFSDYIDGSFEDYLVFGNKVLQILVKRKHRLNFELRKIEEEHENGN